MDKEKIEKIEKRLELLEEMMEHNYEMIQVVAKYLLKVNK